MATPPPFCSAAFQVFGTVCGTCVMCRELTDQESEQTGLPRLTRANPGYITRKEGEREIAHVCFIAPLEYITLCLHVHSLSIIHT